MFIRFLKKMAIVLAFMFAAQGCALYLGGDDGFHDFHHFHHGYRGQSSPQQDQVAENGRSTRTSGLDGGGR